MKLLLVIFGALGTSVGAVALMTPAASGPAWTDGHLARMRGRDVYYAEGEERFRTGPIQVQLRGRQPAMVLVLTITWTCRRGLETGDPAPLAERQKPRLLDALQIYFSDCTPDRFETAKERYRLKREVRDLIGRTVFPGQEARVERVWFEQLALQANG